MRLAQDRGDDAAATIRRALGEATRLFARVALLPAHVEIMLAVGELEDARRSAAELAEIAERQRSEVLNALSAQAGGAVALADGDAAAALPLLRLAWRSWIDLEVPYEAARARLLVGLACSELGDEDSAKLELEAARAVFAALGARPDLARVEQPSAGHGLTKRELEVLRLVAEGRSNHAIAVELFLSDHTVRRHLQNIFRKLDVSSRAAATAFAFEHHLV